MDLVKIVRSKEVESVFVDGLDRFMYSECKEASSREIAQLGLQMKKCWFRWNTVFVVVNNLYENRHWCNNGDVYSPLLGYGWSYVANWKYLLKKQGGMRVLEDLEGNEVMKFKIEGFGRIRVVD
ncbi:hypothetical protein ECANGB1_1023 [Enterospora canceri]|uniref:DNA recombination and repair protein Rad51-like C-terminal domain-containing protein n=1 Tax=Enterospora canceri TaxID=1081671 RepID=A0A1Y1S710_9MICR|nr:hypothetical protein ECANGB1_1023 [Enterospora canceri]